MRLKWTKFIVAMTLALVMGVQWIALQTFGWVQMFVTFAQTEPVKEALIKTFDGQHPCKVCKLVQAGKQTEKKHQPRKVEAKFDYWLAQPDTFLFPPRLHRLPPVQIRSPGFCADTPPTPPPRAA